jgi:hypothetical protein
MLLRGEARANWTRGKQVRAKEEIQQTIPKLFNRPQQPNRGLVGELQANARLDDWMKCGGYEIS